MEGRILVRVDENKKEAFENALIESSLTKAVVTRAFINKFIEKREEAIRFLFS